MISGIFYKTFLFFRTIIAQSTAFFKPKIKLKIFPDFFAVYLLLF